MNKNISKLGKVLTPFPAFAVIVIILSVLIPLSTSILDILIGLNLLFTIIIFFIILSIDKTYKFSAFPAMVLISSIFTVAISISTIRAILSKGAEFDGWWITLISNLIAGTENEKRLFIGFILFLVFIGFFFVVIVKGMVRVSEIAARFILDSMQVRMMAIEVDINSGTITEDEAQLRKKEILEESDFLGSLDGASKFTSGNIKIILFIIMVIIFGGIAVDYLERSIDISTAIKTYIYFSIGSGIVFTLPTLFISTAMGIIVTRMTKEIQEKDNERSTI